MAKRHGNVFEAGPAEAQNTSNEPLVPRARARIRERERGGLSFVSMTALAMIPDLPLTNIIPVPTRAGTHHFPAAAAWFQSCHRCSHSPLFPTPAFHRKTFSTPPRFPGQCPSAGPLPDNANTDRSSDSRFGKSSAGNCPAQHFSILRSRCLFHAADGD